jgi:uncharacterized protein (DUF433 family)
MPVTEIPVSHLVFDDQGRALIRGTTCKVIELAEYHRYWKMDADSLHANLPHLSLAQIHAALSYYYDRQAEFDAQMERNAEWADRMRQQQGGNPVTREQLLARLENRQS